MILVRIRGFSLVRNRWELVLRPLVPTPVGGQDPDQLIPDAGGRSKHLNIRLSSCWFLFPGLPKPKTPSGITALSCNAMCLRVPEFRPCRNRSASCFCFFFPPSFSFFPAFDVGAFQVPLTSEAALAEAGPLLETNGDGESLCREEEEGGWRGGRA